MKKDKTRIIKFLESIEWLFQINGYEKKVVLMDSDKGDTAAEVNLDIPYQRIEILIYPSFLKQNLYDQRKALLHELCHVLTLPSKEAAHELLEGKLITADRIKKINEEATSKIENILDGLLQGRLTYAKKAYKQFLK